MSLADSWSQVKMTGIHLAYNIKTIFPDILYKTTTINQIIYVQLNLPCEQYKTLCISLLTFSSFI